MFLDSDDAFTPLAFDEINAALSKDLDLLIFGFRQCFLTSARDMEYIPNGKFSIDEFYKNNLLNQVWNKAYRRQFIIDNNIKFRPYKYGEDRLFNGDVLSCAPRVVTIEKVLYDYMIDKSVSLISGYNEHKFEACVEIHKSFSSLCKDKTVLSFMLLKNVLSCMTVLFADNCHLSKGEKKSKIKAILQNDDILDDIDLSQMSLPYKIIGKIINI